MKCTLRKTSEGIVATIDERPKLNDYYFSEIINEISKRDNNDWDYIYLNKDKIIASSIPNVGKELKFSRNGNILTEGVTTINFNTEHEYTETEKQIIIKL